MMDTRPITPESTFIDLGDVLSRLDELVSSPDLSAELEQESTELIALVAQLDDLDGRDDVTPALYRLDSLPARRPPAAGGREVLFCGVPYLVISTLSS